MSTREKSTKRRLLVTALACLAVATLGANAAAEEKLQKLTGGQIRAKLTGMELTDNVHWRDLYQRNVSNSMQSWFCSTRHLPVRLRPMKEPIPTCYDVWISGKDVELRREGLLPLQGTLEPSSGRN